MTSPSSTNNNTQQSTSGSLLSRGKQPNNAQQNPPQPPGRFPTPQQVNWMTLPLSNTVVCFELNGLGDPFYKLLGHELNPEYGQSQAVARALEANVEAVDEMEALLDAAWDSYDFHGATLMYTWNTKIWKSIAQPEPMTELEFDFLEEQTEEKQEKKKPPWFKVIRALDLALVLNVLARSRTQLLLASSPLVFSQHYLQRALVTDDERLVSLARSTGYLEIE